MIYPLNAPFLAYFKRTEYLRRLAAAGGLVHFYPVGDELPEVFVGRHHKNLKARRLGLMGEGSDHVVGLIAR